MEVRFLIAKSDLDQILSNSEYALVGVSARKDHTFSSITAEHIGHNNIEDSIFEKASEKHNLMATDALWQEKLSEFERINESVARRIAFRWQMEKKGLEQIIDENLKSNQDIYEKATAVRIQFEFEKVKLEQSSRDAESYFSASISSFRKPPPLNHSPPFIMFPTSCNPGDFVGAKGRSSGEKVEFDYGYDENMDNNMQIVNVKDENGTSTNAWKDQNEKYGWGWEDGCMTARGCSRSTIDDYSTSYLNSSNEENQGNHNKERDTNPVFLKKRKFCCPTISSALMPSS